jgi:hypothetical protein
MNSKTNIIASFDNQNFPSSGYIRDVSGGDSGFTATEFGATISTYWASMIRVSNANENILSYGESGIIGQFWNYYPYNSNGTTRITTRLMFL